MLTVIEFRRGRGRHLHPIEGIYINVFGLSIHPSTDLDMVFLQGTHKAPPSTLDTVSHLT